MAKVLAAAGAFARDEEGASLVEYALALVLIAVVTIASIATLGTKLSAFFDAASTTI